MKEVLYEISKVVATLSGLLLAIPYIQQIRGYLAGEGLSKDILRQNAPFTIAILGFTFAALMNFIQFGNWSILLAQLFSAIPLTIIHVLALIEGDGHDR